MRDKWCIPTVGAEFVWHMEDVLDIYATPHDPRRPQVCFDEHVVQLISEKRQPLPSKPGRPERYDYEYKREGTRLFHELLGNIRERVTDLVFKVQVSVRPDLDDDALGGGVPARPPDAGGLHEIIVDHTAAASEAGEILERCTEALSVARSRRRGNTGSGQSA